MIMHGEKVLLRAVEEADNHLLLSHQQSRHRNDA